MRTACTALVLALATLVGAAQGPDTIGRSRERFTMRVVASGLDAPWEIVWGPDGHLWVTERVAKRVLRINPADGAADVLLALPGVRQTIIQDGLLGLALHPDFLQGTGRDEVYLSFTYNASVDTDPAPRLAIWRYRYDAGTRTLVDPVPVLTGLPSHDDHVGGRLTIGSDRRLYLTIGDLGSNFGRNRCEANRAQDLPSAADVAARHWAAYAGTILRIDLDGGIPDDNPILGGLRSHVFSYGHRNPLGLVFGPNRLLYASEHGPETDDELNLIEAGRNYGWPHVAGFHDDRTYVYANWSASDPEPCASLPAGRGGPPPSVPLRAERAWSHPQFAPPLRTFFTFDTADAAREGGGGTVAPGGLGVHLRSQGGGIPGWNDSLLVLSMLKGVVYRVPLAADGRSVLEPVVEVFKTTNRYRDIAVHPDRTRFYLATDPSGRTTDENGQPTMTLANPGSILEFVYAD